MRTKGLTTKEHLYTLASMEPPSNTTDFALATSSLVCANGGPHRSGELISDFGRYESHNVQLGKSFSVPVHASASLTSGRSASIYHAAAMSVTRRLITE